MLKSKGGRRASSPEAELSFLKQVYQQAVCWAGHWGAGLPTARADGERDAGSKAVTVRETACYSGEQFKEM